MQHIVAALENDTLCQRIFLHCPQTGPPRHREELTEISARRLRTQLHTERVQNFLRRDSIKVVLIRVMSNAFNEAKGCGRVLPFTEIYNNRTGLCIQRTHLQHLTCALVHICLVDTKGVNPQDPLSSLTHMKEGGMKVSGNLERVAIETDVLLVVGIAPHIWNLLRTRRDRPKKQR